MPTYEFQCPKCGEEGEELRRMIHSDMPKRCAKCDAIMERVILTAPGFKFNGRITPGGGPDRLTADMLGIPLKDLPTGLRTSKEDMKRVEEAGE